ncbi:ATP-binding cassette sub-family A member 8 [Tupaia chinensis]|uniref:ATP-binding cassette sub-family A member 8 n=1 Tax=Tupaia chinensis TaxID=246437 RepID=L9KXK9_TUPCH|nr:ATP-binding cassette sub-family A member 8 [Tupaia chinensis]
MSKRERSVCQQTLALLCKNVLKKWRIKREFLLEWLISLLLLLSLYLYPHSHDVIDFSSLPTGDLGPVDSFRAPRFSIVYSPLTNTTQQIMNKVASASFLNGSEVLELSDEESIQNVDHYLGEVVRVIFSSTYSYHLKFSVGSRIPEVKEHRDHTAPCTGIENIYCEDSIFWDNGFLTLQAAINAAIIEIALTLLMSVLVKKSFLTGLVVFLLTLFWGSLGFTALYRHLPASLEWILSLFSPFAFMLGISQLLHLDYDSNSNALPHPSEGSNLIIATHFMLAFDTFLYLVLMIYFEKVLPNEYGRQYSPLFFLKSSFWSRQQKADRVVLEDEIDSDPSSSDSFEPISPEFHGKEAIRIRNVTKEYKGKLDKIEALKGSVSIYNNKFSETVDLENISKLTGVCPQYNVQFDFLTVKENLRLFAKIKGILPQEVDEEIQKVLLELEMKNIQDVIAQNLSGGQKRKLTFGIAILGDPQIFLLDEPTAGLDPFSRHRVWNFLKERKTDCVILFSTQFMDEADILADRKVFLSKGMLKCAGSSLFLKKKWGIGYHLSLQLNEICVQENITSLVKQHIPDAKLSAESEGKLVYTLPLERTNKFPDLYKDLDSCPGLGIESYGVSMTTLSEVFLKLEGKSAIDESDVAVFREVQAESAGDTERLVEMEQLISSLNEMKKTVDGMALWGQQICAMARVRLLKLKHEKSLLSLLLIIAIGFSPLLFEYIIVKIYQSSYTWELSPHLYFLAPGQEPRDPLTQLLIINKTEHVFQNVNMKKKNELWTSSASARKHVLLIIAIGFSPLLFEYIIVKIYQSSYTWELSPHLYFLAPGQEPRDPLTQLLIINKTGANMDDFIHSVERQNIALEVDALGMRNGVDDLSYNGAIIVSGDKQEKENYPFEFLGHSFIWLVLVSSCPPYIAMSSIDDYKHKTWSQLRISGLFPSAYWFGQALVDIPLYFSVFVFMYVMDYIFNSQKTILTFISQFIQKPVIIASCLRKEYAGKQKRCFSKKKKKIATRNVSFCVRKGEVLGLLGHNGAGKSTSIKVITGDTKPTAGQVQLKGSSRGDTLGFLGYCPQENALWANLTVREHLEVYAAVKGLRKADAKVAITRLVDALKLQDQLKAPVKTLSEGIKRKLCFVLSILGTPSVVLLDEPSTGMDPEGQQQMWQAIRATFRNTERGALLTTHYMAEAEAVCDRVAIMVSGRLRCIGSIQHLKSKYGKDYLLEMKVKTPAQVEPLHTEILKLFPQAARQQRFSSLMVYKLPVEDVKPLAQAFFKLEKVKQSFDLEEYSLSQSTLEQVFLELSKEQELHDFHEELDASMKWKLLPQEEP